MVNRESRPTITESVVEPADSVVELANSTIVSISDLAQIGLWVWAFSGVWMPSVAPSFNGHLKDANIV